MIEREFRNIAKLEKNERKFNELTLNDFFLTCFLNGSRFSQISIH